MAHPTWGFEDVHNYHRDGRGWAGIGYNYWIGFDGKIYEGRGLNIGAHAGAKWNPISLGIGYQGDFSKQKMTDEQLKSGILLNYQLAKKYGLTINDIVGHKDVSATDCPGNHFRMKELREGVAKRLNNKPTLILNNKAIDLEIIDGRTYAPVREILETLGFKVNWDAKTKTVTVKDRR
jgi:N-acetyl-anhydromuramyl-L-alanine amidase AmpD